MKHHALVLLAALVTVSTLATASTAATPTNPPWYEVTVDQAGVAQGNPNPAYIVILTDVGGAFTERWFKVDPTIAKPVLATALTAQATGKHARVYISNPAAGQPVLRFYLLQSESVPANLPPIASVEVLSPACAGAAVYVNGTLSSDPEGQGLTYSWTLLPPAGGSGSLCNSTASETWFFPVDSEAGQTYTVQLVVNDGTQNSQPIEVSVLLEGAENPLCVPQIPPVCQ